MRLPPKMTPAQIAEGAADGANVTGTQSALLILTAALTSSWLIVSPASARRIIGSLTSVGELTSSRAVPSPNRQNLPFCLESERRGSCSSGWCARTNEPPLSAKAGNCHGRADPWPSAEPRRSRR